MESANDHASAPAATRAAGPGPESGAWLAAAAFAGCTLIWSSTFLLISIGNDSLPPVWAASLRLFLAALILGAIALASGQGLPRGAAARAASWYGLLQFGLNFPLLYWGEKVLPSGLTAVLFATIPLSSALFAHGFGLERFTPLKAAAAAVALAGIAVIFSGQIHGVIPVLPFVAVLAAATAASLGTVMLKRGPRQSPFGANAWGAAVGLPLCLAASFALGEAHPLPRTPGALLPLLTLTLAGSVGAFVLMAWLVHRWPVTRISFISVVTPMIAVTLGWLFRGERLGPASLAGSLLVVTGVAIAILGDRRRPAREG
jgi:drug/metabolite transporter (DMT)-like permease